MAFYGLFMLRVPSRDYLVRHFDFPDHSRSFFFSAGPGLSNNRYYNVIKGGFYDILFSGPVESRFMTPALRRVKAGYSKVKPQIRR